MIFVGYFIILASAVAALNGADGMTPLALLGTALMVIGVIEAGTKPPGRR